MINAHPARGSCIKDCEVLLRVLIDNIDSGMYFSHGARCCCAAFGGVAPAVVTNLPQCGAPDVAAAAGFLRPWHSSKCMKGGL